MLVPKLFTTIRQYDRNQLSRDLAAGVVVGIVALPLAIAFAIASGVTPDRGLYTAVIAGFLISALGGSRVQIGGPTGAFVVIVYGIVQQHGIEGLIAATILAGLILIALGVSGLGSAVKFIPHPVVTGFTSGIALIIFSSQVKDLLGLSMGAVPADFVEKWFAFARAAATASGPAIGVASLAILILLAWPRVSRKVPAPVVALVATAILVRVAGIDVETLGDRFGDLAFSFPAPRLPTLRGLDLSALVGPAISIALLGAVESLLSAVVADGMIGGRHRSNMELLAQGIANVVTPVFGGIPATGAIARTATNVKNGGRTPVAGMTHALTLLVITLFFGRWAAFIPFATLAAILVVVAYNMSEWRAFVAEFRAPRSDLLVMLATFTLTVLVDLTVAIQVGMVMAAFLFMKRMAEVTNVQVLTRELRDDTNGDSDARARAPLPDFVDIFEINGPFFFGAAKTFMERVEGLGRRPRVLILRMRNVPAIDSTAIHALTEVIERSRREGCTVLLAEVHSQPLIAIGRARLIDRIGEDRLFGTLDEALDAARTLALRPRGDSSGR